MPDDERLTWDLIFEVLDVMERHGYRRGDNQHTGQVIGLIRDTARVYEGTPDAPPGGYVVVPSSRPTAPQPPGLSGVILDGHEGDALAGHEWAREKAPPVGSAGPCGARVVVVVTGLAVVSRSLG